MSLMVSAIKTYLYLVEVLELMGTKSVVKNAAKSALGIFVSMA